MTTGADPAGVEVRSWWLSDICNLLSGRKETLDSELDSCRSAPSPLRTTYNSQLWCNAVM